MALIYQLAVECGAERSNALQIARHFDGATWVLLDGLRSEIHVDWERGILPGDDGNWWLEVSPSGLVGKSGTGNPVQERQMDEAGLLLYERLRTAPPLYRFAVAGLEAFQFNTADSFDDLLGRGLNLSGLVLSVSLWESLRRPKAFEPFARGYRWCPYLGVRHQESRTR